MNKLAIISILVLFTFIGCKDDDNGDNINNNGTQPANEVRMSSGAFLPQTLTINAGTTVRWHNTSQVNHTVTSNNNLFDESVAAGDDFSYTFSTAGTYTYICTIHTGMSGTIVVK